MQDEEPPPGTFPPGPDMPPLAVANWIAFRHAADRDLRGQTAGIARWSVGELGNLFNALGLAVLRELAGGPSAWVAPEDAANLNVQPGRCAFPGWLLNSRSMARLIVRERAASVSALAEALESELRAQADRDARYQSATAELLSALGTGKLTATACAPAAPGSYDAAGDHTRIDPLVFKKKGLTFLPSGILYEAPQRFPVLWNGVVDVSSARGPVLLDVRLSSSQVGRRWPAAPIPRRSTRKSVPASDLDRTLLAYCKTHPTGRRKRGADAVPWLMTTTGCSRDAANAAYTRLPHENRNRPGKPTGANPPAI